MSQTLDIDIGSAVQSRTWHELMIPQRIMRSSIARASEQLDSRCSQQTYHRHNQPHWTFVGVTVERMYYLVDA